MPEANARMPVGVEIPNYSQESFPRSEDTVRMFGSGLLLGRRTAMRGNGTFNGLYRHPVESASSGDRLFSTPLCGVIFLGTPTPRKMNRRHSARVRVTLLSRKCVLLGPFQQRIRPEARATTLFSAAIANSERESPHYLFWVCDGQETVHGRGQCAIAHGLGLGCSDAQD